MGMSPTLNGSADIQRFECSDAIEIHDGIMSVFLPGLPHMYACRQGNDSLYLQLLLHGVRSWERFHSRGGCLRDLVSHFCWLFVGPSACGSELL